MLALLLACLLGTVGSDLLTSITVPQYSFVGSSAPIRCEYDLRNTQLYSLKWYHNRTEFYRYVPTERLAPVNIRPTHKFQLHQLVRDESGVTLRLSQLTLSASGTYRCELIAEHPSFRTETLYGQMTVIREPLYPPLIIGAKDIYDPEDMIEVSCKSVRSGLHGPRATISWYFDGERVSSTAELVTNTRGLLLRLPPQKVLDLGGNGLIECRLTLGNHMEKASKLIRVRHRKSSYIKHYTGKASARDRSSHTLMSSISLLILYFLQCFANAFYMDFL